MGPYLLAGFLIAGLLQAFLDKDTLLRFLGRGRYLQTLRAVILGVPLPVCSCGVLPISATLRQKGAGPGATAGFMLTTPQTGIDSFYATWGILGAPLALFRIVAATVSGIAAGFAAQWVSMRAKERPEFDEAAPKACCPGNTNCVADEPAPEPFRVRLRKAASFALITLPRDVFVPVLVGVLIAAVAQAWLPANVWGNLNTPVWADYFLVLALSLPVYVCSTGAIPIAWALALAGMSPGAVLIFLVAGPASNAGTFTMLARIIGIRASLAAVGTLTFLLLCLGMTVDLLDVDLLSAVSGHAHDHGAEASTIEAALALLALAVFGFSYLQKALNVRRAARAQSCCSGAKETTGCCDS